MKLPASRKLVCGLCSMVFFVSAAGFSLADDAKQAFVQRCGSCHGVGKAAAPVNPADKAGRVWVKYFKRNRHPEDLSSIPAADMEAIIQYLQDHAADSDQPEAAAIPK